MNKNIKIISVLLISALLLSGCGNRNPNSRGDGTTAATGDTNNSGVTSDGRQTLPVSGDDTESPAQQHTTWSLARSASISVGGGYLSETENEIYRDEPAYVNYLTGETLSDEDSSLGIARPAAVCIMNTASAVQVQKGLSGADVVWEISAGSQASRLIALYYKPSGVNAIGPVAAVAPCMVEIGEGYDAYLLFNGTVGNAQDVILEQQSDTVNAAAEMGTSCFFTDSAVAAARGYSESVFTGSGSIANTILTLAKGGAHVVADSRYLTPFAFSQDDSRPGGGYATRVHLDYGGFQPYFLYNTQTGLYARYEHGAPQVDAENNTALTYKNVLVLVSPGSDDENWSCVGVGTGIYVSNGRYQNINWYKESPESPIHFTDAGGVDIRINIGKTFISVVDSEADLTVS